MVTAGPFALTCSIYSAYRSADVGSRAQLTDQPWRCLLTSEAGCSSCLRGMGCGAVWSPRVVSADRVLHPHTAGPRGPRGPCPSCALPPGWPLRASLPDRSVGEEGCPAQGADRLMRRPPSLTSRPCWESVSWGGPAEQLTHVLTFLLTAANFGGSNAGWFWMW